MRNSREYTRIRGRAGRSTAGRRRDNRLDFVRVAQNETPRIAADDRSLTVEISFLEMQDVGLSFYGTSTDITAAVIRLPLSITAVSMF